jgi:MYXO-CTERM domain-containing protein
MLFPLVASGPALAFYDTGIYTPVDDTGDTGDSGDSGDDPVVIPAPDNEYDGHLDGQLAYQLAGDDGGCATVGGPADLALALALVGALAGRLRRPRR